MKPKRVFIHGLESSSQGTKGIFFRDRYPDMLIEDYFGSFKQRMAKLNALLSNIPEVILVGSSYGGLMATIYAFHNEQKVRKLILLAPALTRHEFQPYLGRTLHIPVFLYHGAKDDVVPPSPVKTIAESVFTHLHYQSVDDDHSLHKTFRLMDWDTLLEC